MAANNEDMYARAIRKLNRLADLDVQDIQAIRTLPIRIEAVAANDFIITEGDVPTHCCLLIDGYVCRHKETSDGKRQIVSFHHPGDIIDLQHLMLERADHNVQAIASAVVGWIPAREMKAVLHSRPNIADALWRDTLIDASIFREWVLNVGRRDAKARIAHMLCEFAARRQAAGFGPAERFELPMTQEQIADATGITSVHVNRMLHELDKEHVIARNRRELHIVDWPQLKRIADFDDAYLHMAA